MIDDRSADTIDPTPLAPRLVNTARDDVPPVSPTTSLSSAKMTG